MTQKDKICEKIRAIYPEVGRCGVDVQVEYDEDQSAYVVGLKRGQSFHKTYLEPEDALACLEGKKCLHLGNQISQLVNGS